jgi:hypothetical protein
VVLDPTPEKVNVRRMMLYSIIFILSIYAGWRIQKFWVLLGINLLAGYGISLTLDSLFIPYPYAYVVSFVINGIVSLYAVRYFAKKYNEKIIGQL